MDISTNYLICIGIVIVAAAVVIIMLVKNSKKDTVALRPEYRTIWDVVNYVKDYMVEMLGADISEDVTDEEFDRLYRRVAKIRSANKNATFGMDAAKALIKDIIAGAIAEELLDTEIDNILGMSPGQVPSIHTMFEAIMQKYKVRYGKAALQQYINNYKFAEAHLEKGKKRYYISIEDIYNSYQAEEIEFNKKEKIKLLSTLVYQLYRGFGIIDTIREMNIDGLNIGTSGSILSNLEGNTVKKDVLKPEEEATRGCWLYFQGRYIHLRFMDFGSQDEVKRIVNLLIRYNSSGTLTAKRGYMVNTMYDKSRLLAFRPPVAEYYAAFIRKFTLSSITIESLICKDNVEHGELACAWLRFLMRGLITSIITGRQGSGKTTLMSALIEFVDPAYNIRVLEMAPELYLRELYKDRNILSAQETQYVSGAEIQAAFKKSDSAMSICGEIANDNLACRFMEFGRVASIMNLATHHANTTYDLVIALANCLVNMMHTSVEAGIQQVIDLVKIDVHMDYTKEGFRYIERISEVVPVNSSPYEYFEFNRPERKDFETPQEFELALKEYEIKLKEYHTALDREYYTRQTDRQMFKVNQLIHFDLKTMSYVVDNPPSPELIKRMEHNMTESEIKELQTFLIEHYEIQNAEDIVINVADDLNTLNDSLEHSTGITSSDMATADALLDDLTSSPNDAALEGLVDMGDAISAIRQTNNPLDITSGFDYTSDDTTFGMEAVDNLVQIEAEEDAKMQSRLYAPYTEDGFKQLLEDSKNPDLQDVEDVNVTENLEDVILSEDEKDTSNKVDNVFDTIASAMNIGKDKDKKGTD